MNVPAPVYNTNSSPDLNSKVSRTVDLFNSALKENVRKHNLGLIDVFRFTLGKNDYSNGLFHIDNNHLGALAIPEIEK